MFCELIEVLVTQSFFRCQSLVSFLNFDDYVTIHDWNLIGKSVFKRIYVKQFSTKAFGFEWSDCIKLQVCLTTSDRLIWMSCFSSSLRMVIIMNSKKLMLPSPSTSQYSMKAESIFSGDLLDWTTYHRLPSLKDLAQEGNTCPCLSLLVPSSPSGHFLLRF